MMRSSLLVLSVALFGAVKVPIEKSINRAYRDQHCQEAKLDLVLRDQIGQRSFVAGLSGFRSLVADLLFVQAHLAWERREWERILLVFQQITTLQPRVPLFWERAAWQMGWNASAAAANDPREPRLTLRIKAQRDYLRIGKDFLERGILNNPDCFELHEALARLYRDKYHDHLHAADCFDTAASLPGAPGYLRRFAAYELSLCNDREWDAYHRLRLLYARGKEERVPTLVQLLKQLEIKLAIPTDERIGDDG
jgi:hypothetical protein